MAEKTDLATLREVIERIDHDLLALLRERMDVMEGVARQKLQSAVPFRDPSREEQVLARVRAQAVKLKLDAHEVERLYRLIMEMAIARQQAHVGGLDATPLRVAYQGVEASYSHLAAQQRYGGRQSGVVLEGYETIRQSIDALKRGEADYAFVPIENTAAGGLNETYDLLGEGGLTLTGEVLLNLHHCLLGLPGATLADLRTVRSHPQAFSQCARFLSSLPNVRLQPEMDTAGAARKVKAQFDKHVAAIASASAAAQFGLEILHSDIQGEEQHQTRFVEIAVEARPCPPDANCKTSLLLTLEDRPGQLGEALMVFARHGVNLNKLESRPVSRSPFRYGFYLEVEGHQASREINAALTEVRGLHAEVRMLGTYPVAEEPRP